MQIKKYRYQKKKETVNNSTLNLLCELKKGDCA